MRRPALTLAILLWLAAPATAGAHTATDPVTLALSRAEAFWHASPCGGRVGFASSPTVPAQLEVEPANYASSATSPMWSSWQTADGPQSYTAPAYDCLTTVNAKVWPNWHAMAVDFQAFCDEVTHEVGHFLGHPDAEQSEPASIEYPFLGLANFNAVPECRGITLYYGHEAIRDQSEAEVTCEAARARRALAEGRDSYESC
jgi:hypothetical protein